MSAVSTSQASIFFDDIASKARFIISTNYVIHVGRPDREAPHYSMERCNRFHIEHPNIKLIIVLWDEKDRDELLSQINSEKAQIYLWKDDKETMSWLLDLAVDIIGSSIITPRWYKCTEEHLSFGTYKFIKEKCDTCGGGVALVEPFKEKLIAFANLFGKIVSLFNFDTRSGEFLYSMVNPTRNVLLNMPYALGLPDRPTTQCYELKGTGKGKPAIICGAGPSLEDALPYLKMLQEKTVIICVGRAFKLLKNNGVQVNYVLSVEMFDWDSAIFDDIEDVGNTTLAYASVCSPPTVTKWPGKKVCLWDIQTACILERKDHILGGNSIAHHMLNFAAQILECEPIIMVGIDLAYTKPRTHADGTTPKTWPKEVIEKDESYQKELWVPCTGKGNNFHPECHRVPVALGQGSMAISKQVEVRSSYAYQDFATLFSILIYKHGKKVLNACPNGQKIEGAEYVDLGYYNPDKKNEAI